MILSHTLNNLTEEELSLLFFIGDKIMSPLGVEVKRDHLKMLKVHVIDSIIEHLKTESLEEYKNIFDSLKEKISNQI